MELIPILATIILAATASTFLLAVGAYILYKIRERRGKKFITRTHKLEAELVSPARGAEKFHGQSWMYSDETNQNLNLAPFKDETEENRILNPLPVEPKKTKSNFMKYTSEGYISPKEDKKSGNIRWR